MALPTAGSDITASMLRALLAAFFTDLASETKIATSQSTASTSYTDLATVGPAVTLTSTGTRALILWSSTVFNSSGTAGSACTVAISGATVLAAADANGILGADTAGTGFGEEQAQYMWATINPGSNIYTMKYRVTAGTGSFLRRRLLVIAP